MGWNKRQINDHIKAAKLLIKIKNNAFNYLKGNANATEYEVQRFILKQFKENRLKTDKYPSIVAFNEDSATPEFYPSKKSKKLEPNSLVMIDIWAKLGKRNSPFADITWMAYHGKRIPKEILRVFNVAVKARSRGIRLLKSQLKMDSIPTGKEVDDAVKGVIVQAGYRKNILHDVGHSLGTISDHGPKPDWIYPENSSPLSQNMGYTIEPGIYLKNRFGVRSEIDFFIDENMKLVITTDVQKNIIKI